MDLQRKTIQTLTISLDEKRNELSAFYRQFGMRLYADSIDSAVQAGALPLDRVEIWRSLASSRDTDSNAIIEIRDAVTRQQELLAFRKELDKTLANEKIRYNEQLESFGRLLFSQYDEARDSLSFGETFSLATAEGRVLSQLEDKQDHLRYELESAGFFGKMFSQFKMAGLASNVRQHKLKMGRILSDGAKTLVTSGAYDEKLETVLTGSDLVDSYAKSKEAAFRLGQIQTKAGTIEADLALVRQNLAVYAAADNPSRRMEELRLRIKESDKRVETLAILSAREYSDKFLDDDGCSLLGDGGDGNTFSDMGAYAHQLEQIAQLRSTISVIRRKIEILETTIKIETIEKNIGAYERTVIDYERKIAHLGELNENLRKNIKDANAERVKLAAHKAEVELTLRDITGSLSSLSGV